MTAINTSNSTWCNMAQPAYLRMTGARREVELVKMYAMAFLKSPIQFTKEYFRPSFQQVPLHLFTKIALISILCLTIYAIYKAFHRPTKELAPETQITHTPPPPPPAQQQNRQQHAPPPPPAQDHADAQQNLYRNEEDAIRAATALSLGAQPLGGPPQNDDAQQNLHQSEDAAIRAAIAASLRPQPQGGNDDAATRATVTASIETAKEESCVRNKRAQTFPEELRPAFTTEIEKYRNVTVGIALRKMLIRGLPSELGEAYASHKAQGLPKNLKEKVFQQWCNPVTNHHALKAMVNNLLPHFTSS